MQGALMSLAGEEKMSEVATVAGSLSDYGLYSIIALLVLAVVSLYKQIHTLNADMRLNLLNFLKEQSELTVRCTVALENSTKAVERIERICDNLTEKRG